MVGERTSVLEPDYADWVFQLFTTGCDYPYDRTRSLPFTLSRTLIDSLKTRVR